jgi:hypothetical protein
MGWLKDIGMIDYWKKLGGMFSGTPEKHERKPTLLPEQQKLYEQLVNAGMQPGAGGAFGTSADYYRDLLNPDSQTAEQMFAPEQRKFQERTIPDLAEQFAGMGAGGLSSSGFRNAAVGAGTDLAERLGSIRAQLRSQGAAGLAGIGGMGLGNFSQDVMTQPGTEGMLSQLAPLAGAAIGNALVPGVGGVAGYQLGNAFRGSQVGGKSSPYGNQAQAPYGAAGYDRQFRQTGVF